MSKNKTPAGEANTNATVSVLSIGQCGADAPQIKNLLEKNFQARVETADTLKQALHLANENEYDLILVNRILDQTGEEGLKLIDMLGEAGIKRKIMLVSNYPDAQKSAVSLGAHLGFGKNSLRDPSTVATIQKALDSD